MFDHSCTVRFGEVSQVLASAAVSKERHREQYRGLRFCEKQRGTLTASRAGRVQEGWCCFHSSIFATPFIDSDQRLSFFGICLQYPRFLVPKWLPKHVGGEVTQRVGMGEATQSLD